MTLGPQHTMNEMERARAGIDHRGQPLPGRKPNFGAVLAGWRADAEDERMRLLDEARADTGSGAFDDDRDYEIERRERDSL